MQNILLFIQGIVSGILIGLIIIQARGTGLSRGWAASQTSFSRRGLEKLIFKSTFFLSALFILISLASLTI